MYMKIHKSAKGTILALCDEELIGKVLEDKNRYIDLDKYRSFYIGESVTKDQVKNSVTSFSSANIVGKKSVDLMIELELVHPDEVVYIKKVPFVQIYKI